MNRAWLSPLAALLMATPLILQPRCAWAADSISPDRPDFVDSSDVVGKGRVQIETGWSSERNEADGVRTRTRTTPTLLRIGMSERWELRIDTDGAVRADTRVGGVETSERGAADTGIGIKWHVQDGDEAAGKPGIGWEVHADFDSGSAAFRGDGVRPSTRVVAEWDLPRGFSLGMMSGLLLDRNASGQRYVGGILAASLGKSWTDAWHSFVELAGQQLAQRKNGGNVVSVDTGLSYQASDSLQFDAAVFRGLTRDTPDLQWGVGMSVRF